MRNGLVLGVALWAVTTNLACTYEPTQNTRLSRADQVVTFKGFYTQQDYPVQLEYRRTINDPWVQFGSTLTTSSGAFTDTDGVVWFRWEWSGTIPESAWLVYQYPDTKASIRVLTDFGVFVAVDDNIEFCAAAQGFVGVKVLVNCQSSQDPNIITLLSCVLGTTYSNGECVADRDFDGVPDTTDNCPDFPNPDQEPPVAGSPPGDECMWNETPFIMSEIQSIVPLGTVSGPEAKNRLQIQIPVPPSPTPRAMVSVFAPVAMRVTSVTYKAKHGDEVENWDFFAEVTRLSDEDRGIMIGFAHITHPLPGSKLALAIPKVEEGETSGPPTSPITFDEGELIGKTIGSALAGAAFDYFVYNQNNPDGSSGQAPYVTNTFANQLRYETDPNLRFKRIADCPVYYQDAETRAELEAKFGYEGPVLGADCRQVSRDVPGTLAGQWFDDVLEEQFAIATEMVGAEDPADGVINGVIRVTCNDTELCGGSQNMIVDYSLESDPEQIVYSATDPTSGRHCYYRAPTAIHFDMESADSVRVRIANEDCPNPPGEPYLDLGPGDQLLVR